MSEETACVKLDIGKAVSDSFGQLKGNLGLLIVSGLIASILSGFLFGLFAGAMVAGMFMIADRLVTGDETKPTVGDLFKGFAHLIPALGLLIVGSLGVFACGIGLFVTMPVALLGILRIVDKGVSIGEAISFGWDVIIKQKQWMFIVLMIVAGILAEIGVVLCGIGIFVTLPLYYLILANGYRQICPKA